MTRLDRHEKIAAALAGAPGDVLAGARPLGAGIGGSTWLLRVAGEPVFVKRVALTDVELANPAPPPTCTGCRRGRTTGSVPRAAGPGASWKRTS